MGLEWDPKHTPNVKLGLHATQLLISFVAWCLEIAVFRGKDAQVNGKNGWTFAVMFLSVPAWVYLVMTPRFSRTRRFAEPHAMLAVDGVFTLIWLSAFATQASYNTNNQCGKVCNLSKAIVGLGVLNTLLFAGTTFVSAYSLTFYNFHGSLPGYDSRKIRTGDDNSIDPDKAAFSMAPHDEEAYERVNADDHEAPSAYGAGGYGDSNPYSAGDDIHDLNRYGSPAQNHTLYDSNVEYTSGAGPAPSDHGHYDPPPAGDVQFPAADYGRVQR